MKINNFELGKGKTFIIAELSANHNQNLDVAIELIQKAHWAGADAIKIQTYRPDTITIDSDKDYFMLKDTIWKGQTLYNLYEKAYTPWEWTQNLKEEANKLGMIFFSSPFDVTAVDFLENVGVPVYKVASFEITDHILLKKIAHTGKPVIVSTGMASLGDIASAIKVLKENGCQDIALLKCTSSYPAKPEQANLITIPNLAETFGVFSGLSDHTLGIEVPVVSVALGAKIIEKHFTLSRDNGSPDDSFSLEPHEFKQMVESVRIAEKTLGTVTYGGVDSETSSKKLRRSLFFVKDVQKGEILTKDNVKSIRPGHGLHTKYYDSVLGYQARFNIERGTPVDWKLID